MTRVLALAEKGFPMEEFIRLRLGVVIMKDELEYRREVKWMEAAYLSLPRTEDYVELPSSMKARP